MYQTADDDLNKAREVLGSRIATARLLIGQVEAGSVCPESEVDRLTEGVAGLFIVTVILLLATDSIAKALLSANDAWSIPGAEALAYIALFLTALFLALYASHMLILVKRRSQATALIAELHMLTDTLSKDMEKLADLSAGVRGILEQRNTLFLYQGMTIDSTLSRLNERASGYQQSSYTVLLLPSQIAYWVTLAMIALANVFVTSGTMSHWVATSQKWYGSMGDTSFVPFVYFCAIALVLSVFHWRWKENELSFNIGSFSLSVVLIWLSMLVAWALIALPALIMLLLAIAAVIGVILLVIAIMGA